ncbi:MAG: hypothetical protein RIR35_185, partial [Actinomycetota bacterium]
MPLVQVSGSLAPQVGTHLLIVRRGNHLVLSLELSGPTTSQ